MKQYILHFSIFALSLFTLFSCQDDKDTTPDQKDAEVVKLNIDVVLPTDIREQWQNSIDMAMDNIAKAQQKMDRKIVLNLRYHEHRRPRQAGIRAHTPQ